MHAVNLPIPVDHPVFAGHFPGQPLVPGVLLLAHVLEAALADARLAHRLGATPRLSNAKFLAPVRPGDTIEVHIAEGAGVTDRLQFELRCGDRVAASGQFESVQA